MRYAARPLKIGSFSAASNVTGIATDTRAIAALLHRHGALSFWDFAAAGPYVEIEMNARTATARYKDAMFLSPHKFIGGPQTPGVLVAKRALFTNTRARASRAAAPSRTSTQDEHRYLADPVHREEGGTPAIIESIRAGLVFQLKEAVGAEAIREREVDFIQRAIASWSTNPNLAILGNQTRGGCRSCRSSCATASAYLHHNFVVALLNDLFGIQARGGCGCAGPYGHRLLGIDLETSKEFEREIVRGCEGIKPGWVRVNFNYFLSETLFQFLLDAIHLVANDGWRLLPHYRFDPDTGEWRHRGARRDARDAPRRRLVSHRQDGVPLAPRHRARVGAAELPRRGEADHRGDADEFAHARARGAGRARRDFEELRWFPLPSEVLAELRGRADRSARRAAAALARREAHGAEQQSIRSSCIRSRCSLSWSVSSWKPNGSATLPPISRVPTSEREPAAELER